MFNFKNFTRSIVYISNPRRDKLELMSTRNEIYINNHMIFADAQSPQNMKNGVSSIDVSDLSITQLCILGS